MESFASKKIRKNIKLACYTTYKIGGTARCFFPAKNEEHIAEAVLWARQRGMPYFILGGGSNILVSDEGFNGLVIRMLNTKCEIRDTHIEVEAGVDLPKLVQTTVDNGLKGLEWASGVPGTFGGAVRGNAGAFGGEIKDLVTSVRFLDEKGNIRTVSNGECNFVYRGSIFKENSEFIILSAVLSLERGDRDALQKFSKEKIAYRAARHPLEYGSCGSVFKAIDVNDIPPGIFDSYPRFRESIKRDPFPVVPTACFIDEAGLKRYRIGGAMVSDKHPNFFVNFERATAEDVKRLIDHVKHSLRERFGVKAEEEVQFVGWEKI